MRKTLTAVVLLSLCASASWSQIGTAFTYQGRLSDGALPANGIYDFEFQLFTAVTAGSGSTVQTLGDVTVATGLFAVTLDFGPAFTGSRRWLEIRVRSGASTGAYTTLTPRQELTPAPNAAYAAAAGTVAANGVDTAQLADGAVTALKLGSGAVTSNAIASGQVVKTLNGAQDTVTIVGSGGATVSTIGSAITITAAPPTPPLPSGALVLGASGDTTLIGAGYTELPGARHEVWTATATAAGVPSARANHTAVWTGSKMIIWGGFDGLSSLNTGGQYDPVGNSWTPTATTAGVPNGRSQHTAVWTGSKMIVWGGSGGSGHFNTGGQYDPATDAWTVTAATDAPTARSYHTAIWTGAHMIVWGGRGPNPVFSEFQSSEGGRYDPVADTWTATTTLDAPLERESHGAVWTGSRMIVWGGRVGLGTVGVPYVWLDSGGQYDPVADVWTPTTGMNAPQGRYHHTTIWTGSRMIVWGGSGAGPVNTGGQYDPLADSWTGTANAGTPSGHTAVWTGSKMIVWGGSGPSGNTNSGVQYDPVRNTWTPTATTAGVPTARTQHTAVWAGSKMIVWGGYDGANLNTGGQWFELSYFIKN